MKNSRCHTKKLIRILLLYIQFNRKIYRIRIKHNNQASYQSECILGTNPLYGCDNLYVLVGTRYAIYPFLAKVNTLLN